MRRLASRVVSSLLIAVVAVGCSDSPTSLRHTPLHLALVPRFSPQAEAIYKSLSAFAVTLNNVHVVVRTETTGDAIGSLLKDTTVAFPATADQITIDIELEIQGPQQDVAATVELRVDSTAYFSGTQDFLAKQGGTATAPQAVSMSYVGPGSTTTFISIAPQPATLAPSASAQFTAQLFDAQEQPVTGLPLTWSINDTSIATVSQTGVVTSSARLGLAARLTVTGLNGVVAQAAISVQQVAGIAVTAGDSLTGIVNAALPTKLQVRALDANGNPVIGATINFSAPGGGSVSPASATTDLSGIASTTMTLGPTVGTYAFTATVAGSPNVTTRVAASATPGPASAILALTPTDTVVNPGQVLDLMSTKITDGVNGVDGVKVNFTVIVGTCTFTGGATQASVTTADGGFAAVQPVLSPNATALSSCAVSALAVNGQGAPVAAPVWFKRYIVDPASTIRIFTGANSTAWTDTKNWWKGVVPAPTDVAWIPSASSVSHTALLNAATSIQSLITESSGRLDLNQNTLTINQNLDAGGLVQNGTLQLNGKGAVATGTVQATVVQGTSGCVLGSSLSVGAAGFIVNGAFTANCTVDATAGALTINGAATFTGPGAALFTGPNSIVSFLGDVAFGGGANSISGGTIQITGNFSQTAGTFVPDTSTRLIFSGTAAQAITLANTQSSLPKVAIQNSVGVTLNPLTAGGLLAISGTVILLNNGKLTVAPGASATINVLAGLPGIYALELYPGSVLTVSVGSALRFGAGCAMHSGSPVPIIAASGTISTTICASVP